MTRRTLLAGLSAAHFAQHVTNSLLSALLPFIRDAFLLSNTQAGFAVTAYTIASGVTNAPLGVLADRIGARRVIVGGLVLVGLSSVAIGLAGSYEWLLIGLVVMGVASATYHAPASALIAETFTFARRGVALGTHTTAGHLAFFAAPLLAGTLAFSGTWRLPYVTFAIAPLACALLLLRIAPPGTRATERHEWLATFTDIGRVARSVGSLVSISIVAQVLLSSALAFLTLYLVDARGVSPVVAAALFGVPQLAGLVAAPLSGVLSDRFGRPAVLLGALVASGPASWLLVAMPIELAVIPLLLIGACLSFRATATEVLIIDNTPVTRRSTVLGTYYLVNQPVGGVAAPIFGAIADAAGIGSAFLWLSFAFVALSVVALVAAATGGARRRVAPSPG
ncbi:MAG TPA: MFS transporter [Candidatus Limnocylindria bacterium]|nr:MFS transporter [Candidatus Limnocylindria bacterium]